ncbi:nucleotidyltransferase family protein [Azospirillum sp. sgz301742]
MPDTSYPTYEDIRARRIAARRAAALDALRRADVVARRAGGRLVVFGSLAEGGFDERSDLDVAVFGLPPGPDGDVAAEVDTVLTLAGFAADVIPDRFLSPSLRERVLSNGSDPCALG